MTGWGQAEDKERSRSAGFDEHLTKPVDLETLERKLEMYLVSRVGVSGAGVASQDETIC
jgi:CheY-like chemotaxis protein